jgi:transcriptional regulator with XRE-family HTH domain
MAQINRDEEKKRLSYVYKRIKEIREELHLSRNELSEAVKMSSISLAQLENYGSASAITIIDIFNYFYKKGKINPLWIIVEDNKNISKKIEAQASAEELVNLLRRELAKE